MLVGLDHITLCMADLDSGMDWFEDVAGVRPLYGGAHDGLGTHNAVVSLGDDLYLELTGIDRRQARPAHMADWHERVERLAVPTPYAWCFRCDDATRTARELTARVEMLEWPSVRRTTPEGEDLEWAMIHLVHQLGPVVVPYFIDWKQSRSPAVTAPGDCTLLEVVPLHPDPPSVQHLFDAAGIDYAVQPAEQNGLRLRLRTPKGELAMETGVPVRR